MAAVTSRKRAKTAFGTPSKGDRHRSTWLDPPVVGVTPYATAGLQCLYTQITTQEPVLDDETIDFTDENGVFCPKTKMPLLARRYRFVKIIGSGVSSITVSAQDTFRVDQNRVAIKVLNVSCYRLGFQESSSVQLLNKVDPDDYSGTLRLLNIFSFSGHFCMVFELLHPKPLHHYFKGMDNNQEKLRWIRKVTIRLLQVLGFLQQENVIHADLKPENVLCKSDDLSSGIKVIDFGNAIHCVYDELSLYYDDFELQTLLYRAPEVLFGLPFGVEIDMWSLGCILAELYIGKPLFFATTKERLLQRMVSVLGPLPSNTLQRGKFYKEYSGYTGKPQTSLVTWGKLHTELMDVSDPHFVSFISAMLQYNPSERISVWDAIQHPFLAPEIAIRYLLPPSLSDKQNYPQMGISAQTYNLSPNVSAKIAKDHLSSRDMLRHGTTEERSNRNIALKRGPKSSGGKVIAEVMPFVNQQQQKIQRTHVPAFPVQQHTPMSSNGEPHRVPAFQVPPPVRSSVEVAPQLGGFDRRHTVRLKSNVRKPVAVPGKFVTPVMHDTQNNGGLSNRESHMSAHYQHSSQMNQLGSAISTELKHEELSNIPSTSSYHQHTLSKPMAKRSMCSHETILNVTDGSVPFIPRNVFDNDVTEQLEYRECEEMHINLGHGFNKRKSPGGLEKGVVLQRGEIFLTRVTESKDSPLSKMIRSNPKQSSARHASKEGRNTSPMSKWNNLEKMRSETLKQNKRKFRKKDQGVDGNSLIKKEVNSKSLQIKNGTAPFPVSESKKVCLTKSDMVLPSSPKGWMDLHSPLRSKHTVPTTPASSSKYVYSPSRTKATTKSMDMFSPARSKQTPTPNTPSNLSASITKLKSSTPETPTNNTVLLLSEFPTPDNTNLTLTHGVPNVTPIKSDIQKSSSSGGSSCSGEWDENMQARSKVEYLDSDEGSKPAWGLDSPGGLEEEVGKEHQLVSGDEEHLNDLDPEVEQVVMENVGMAWNENHSGEAESHAFTVDRMAQRKSSQSVLKATTAQRGRKRKAPGESPMVDELKCDGDKGQKKTKRKYVKKVQRTVHPAGSNGKISKISPKSVSLKKMKKGTPKQSAAMKTPRKSSKENVSKQAKLCKKENGSKNTTPSKVRQDQGKHKGVSAKNTTPSQARQKKGNRKDSCKKGNGSKTTTPSKTCHHQGKDEGDHSTQGTSKYEPKIPKRIMTRTKVPKQRKKIGRPRKAAEVSKPSPVNKSKKASPRKHTRIAKTKAANQINNIASSEFDLSLIQRKPKKTQELFHESYNPNPRSQDISPPVSKKREMCYDEDIYSSEASSDGSGPADDVLSDNEHTRLADKVALDVVDDGGKQQQHAQSNTDVITEEDLSEEYRRVEDEEPMDEDEVLLL